MTDEHEYDYPDENQYGVVLVFKEGTTPKQIREALEGVKHLLPEPTKWSPNGYHLNSFNNKWGYPAWYIP